jgi:haloalkane dehalogenase
MRKVATIPIHTAAELAQTPYTERTIERHNTWTWNAGRRVYELLAPDGSNYLMQSYAQTRDPEQTITDLRTLGDRLALPPGWSYRLRRLKDDLTLRAKHRATVIQDDLQEHLSASPAQIRGARVPRNPGGRPEGVRPQHARWPVGHVHPRRRGRVTDLVDAFRTPDERFEGLPDFPFEPQYRQLDGLRLAHVDEGDGSPVLFVHGEPTWSYLWRKVIPPVLDAGFRCIAPDHAGFGRSDKPMDLGWYSYDRHSELFADLLERLDLRDATVVVHDWGGPIGLRAAVEHPDRIARMVDLPVGFLVKGATAREMSDEVQAAYEAPFPNPQSKAGARAFPLMLPTTPEMPGAAAGKRVLEALRTDERPKLHLWADSDPIIPFKVGERFAAAINADPPEKIENASHFLQEDAGEEIGRRVADWLGA